MDQGSYFISALSIFHRSPCICHMLSTNCQWVWLFTEFLPGLYLLSKMRVIWVKLNSVQIVRGWDWLVMVFFL